jgi:hypothetical protein
MTDTKELTKRLRLNGSARNIEAADELDRLEMENWQLRQACGYPIPADKETINNPFKCGTCDAKSIEVKQLREQYKQAMDILGDERIANAAEIERLQLELDSWKSGPND